MAGPPIKSNHMWPAAAAFHYIQPSQFVIFSFQNNSCNFFNNVLTNHDWYFIISISSWYFFVKYQLVYKISHPAKEYAVVQWPIHIGNTHTRLFNYQGANVLIGLVHSLTRENSTCASYGRRKWRKSSSDHLRSILWPQLKGQHYCTPFCGICQ